MPEIDGTQNWILIFLEKKSNMTRIETLAIHTGEEDLKLKNGSITKSKGKIFNFKDTKQIIDFYEGRLEGIKYGRYGNIIQQAVEEKISALENTERALLFSSGMSAFITTIFSLTEKGDNIIFINDCYRNERKFLNSILPKYGITTTPINVEDIEKIKDYIQPKTRLFFSEFPTNPFLRIIDIERVINILKEKKIISIIDSTFATPINFNPQRYGADIILHSATKYLSGHNDLFAGVVAGSLEFLEKVQEYRDVFGTIIEDEDSSYLLLRSLKTLPIRMNELNKNGLKIASYLENHNKVEKVFYPGIKSHPDYELAKKYLKGFGSVITFYLKATEKQTSKFIDNLKIPYIASNFGGLESVIEQHALHTFYNDKEFAEKIGITGNLVRFSVGMEHYKDLMKDLEQALDKIN